MLCYLRLSVNPNDEESLRRIINKPARGIGDTTVRKLSLAAAESGTTIWEVLSMLVKSEELRVKNNSNQLEGETNFDSSFFTLRSSLKKLKPFYDMIASFHESSATDDAYTLALRIAKESGLQQMIFSGNDPEDVSRQENLQEMIDGIAAFVQDKSTPAA